MTKVLERVSQLVGGGGGGSFLLVVPLSCVCVRLCATWMNCRAGGCGNDLITEEFMCVS